MSLWFPVNLIQAVFVALWSAFWIAVSLVASFVTRSRRPGLWLARRIWAPGLLAAGPVRLQVEGMERIDLSQVYFVVANHQSWVDIPILFAALPFPLLFIAKRELARIPFLRQYIDAMGMIFVDRRDRRESARTVENAADRLRQGWSILSFPEGTRSRDGRVQRFRAATFAAAVDAGAPILPVALEGPARVVARDRLRFRPGTVRIAIGAPIPTAGMSRDQRTDLAEHAQQALAGELARLRGLSRPEDVVASVAPVEMEAGK